MKKLFILILAFVAVLAAARTRTTQSSLRDANTVVETIAPDAGEALPEGVSASDISMKGYSKRKSDSKESFMVTNHTTHKMSHITLMMRYSGVNGEMLHERTVTIPVQLSAGQTQLVSISSWDKQHLFYFYAGPKPRKSATPYKVAYRLTGYDIPVGQQQ